MNATLHRLAAVAVLAFVLGNAALASAGAQAEEFDKYGLESVSAELSTTQAGAHADITLGFAFTRDGNEPYAYAKDIQFKLPPGMIGNPQSVPRCTVDQLGNAPGTANARSIPRWG